MNKEWYHSYDEIVLFAAVLIDVHVLDGAHQTWEYFEKPWKYDREHRLWDEHGRPLGYDSEQWIGFQEALWEPVESS